MDEFTAVLRARDLVSKVNPAAIPVDVESYAAHVSAIIRPQNDLGQDEPGWSFKSGGKHFICINENDSAERQRFTICHELAHIILGLPSEHTALPWWSYSSRPLNEILCDIFAAELLLPYQLFKTIADDEEICFATVEHLAERFTASNTATGSRFAAVITAPCAFVLSEKGIVRYASRSLAMREVNAWIPPRMVLPPGSLSERVCKGKICNGPEEIDADLWLSDWTRGGILLEEARHLSRWDQTLTLLWFEDEEVPQSYEEIEDDLMGLKELDGILPWPGKKRRK
ncbi:MAG: ImmA/IrrE family metallo-endopeptidase [Thermodesulfobacteriota bacterium]